MAAAPVWASLPALPRGDRRTWRRMDVGNNVLDQTLMGLNRFAEFGSVRSVRHTVHRSFRSTDFVPSLTWMTLGVGLEAFT